MAHEKWKWETEEKSLMQKMEKNNVWAFSKAERNEAIWTQETCDALSLGLMED